MKKPLTKSWERKIANYQRWKIFPDIIRWVLIISILCVVFYLIFTADIWGAVVWAILWIIIGFILLLNIIGFLTLPLYYLLALMCGAKSIEKDFIEYCKKSAEDKDFTVDTTPNPEQK